MFAWLKRRRRSGFSDWTILEFREGLDFVVRGIAFPHGKSRDATGKKRPNREIALEIVQQMEAEKRAREKRLVKEMTNRPIKPPPKK